jgi:membrane associated rhomboid family serine protease
MLIAPGSFVKIVGVINVGIAVLMLIPSVWEFMVVAGGLFPARFTQGDAAFHGAFLFPVWLTPISSAFLHLGIMHVGLNMVMLLLIGSNLERVMGTGLVAGLFTIGIFAAALAECAIKPHSMEPIIGASGGLSALIASYAQLFPRQRQKPLWLLSPRVAHAIKLLAAWIALNGMFWFAGPGIGLRIAIWAHIGGFVAGLVLTWPLMKLRDPGP